MKLSIITINRNNAEGLRRTIESVVTQTFTDFEYIIIDGASTDGSVDVITEYADRIDYWVSEPDTGIYNAMNKGILKAKGEYLQFLNSGDWLYDVTVLYNVFKLNRTEDFIYGNVCFVKNENDFFVTNYPSNISFSLFYVGGICHQAVFHKQSLFKEVLYNERLKIFSDYEFFIQKIIIENCSTFFANEIICNYDTNGISSSENKQLVNAYEQERQQILHSFFSLRVLDDYKQLQKFQEEEDTSFFKNIRIIMSQPFLFRNVRRMIKLLTLLVNNKL